MISNSLYISDRLNKYKQLKSFHNPRVTLCSKPSALAACCRLTGIFFSLGTKVHKQMILFFLKKAFQSFMFFYSKGRSHKHVPYRGSISSKPKQTCCMLQCLEIMLQASQMMKTEVCSVGEPHMAPASFWACQTSQLPYSQ